MTGVYVKNNEGKYAVQVRDWSAYHGFSLLTENKKYENGLGFGKEWHTVATEDVPAEIRRKMDHLLSR